MIRRLISLAMLILALGIYVRSLLFPHDVLFFFASTSSVMNVAMIVMVGLAAVVSFRSRFKSWWAYAVSAALAVSLGLLGFSSLFTITVDSWLSGVFLPLNALMILESGVVLGICALSYEHAPRPASLRLPILLWSPRFGRVAGQLSGIFRPAPALPRRAGQRRTQPA